MASRRSPCRKSRWSPVTRSTLASMPSRRQASRASSSSPATSASSGGSSRLPPTEASRSRSRVGAGQGVHPGEQQVAQRTRERGRPGLQQLLGVQRVAFTAREQRADQGGIATAGAQLDDAGDAVAVERRQVDTPRAHAAPELHQRPAERVPAGELVAAVGQHQADRALHGPRQARPRSPGWTGRPSACPRARP